MGTNIVIIEGHMGADPRMNRTKTKGVSVCNFRMATNSNWTDDQGTKHEKAEWHNVVCWNKLAEVVGQYMHKGSHVLVQGRLETRDYDVVVAKQCVNEQGQVLVDPNTQQPYTVNVVEKRYVTEVIASSVKFLDKRADTQAYTPAAGTPVVNAAGNAAAVAPTFVQAAPAAAAAPVAPAVAPAAAAPVAPVAPVADASAPVVVPGV